MKPTAPLTAPHCRAATSRTSWTPWRGPVRRSTTRGAAGVRVDYVHVELGRKWTVERRTVDGREGEA
jgi:hypothetical protein